MDIYKFLDVSCKVRHPYDDNELRTTILELYEDMVDLGIVEINQEIEDYKAFKKDG